MTNENTAENPATSCMNLVRSLRAKYHQMVSKGAEDMENLLDARRRGGPSRYLTKEQIGLIFSLYHAGNATQKQIAESMGLTNTMVGRILRRKHHLSVNQPKHSNET